MTFSDVLRRHIDTGALYSFARESEPHIHYDFDAGEGPRFWAYNHETDELTEHGFTAEQVFAIDWIIKK